MSFSYTTQESFTFTLTNAKHIAAKVATDLKRLQRFYGYPTDSSISNFETEVVALLNAGYLKTIMYGFQRNGLWIEPTLKYSARDLSSTTAVDDDPGRIRAGADISGASFYSYLIRTDSWHSLTQNERDEFEKQLPIKRSGASEPGMIGYFNNDISYSSGGRALDRSSLKS